MTFFLQALPYVCLLIAMLFFIYAIIGMQVRTILRGNLAFTSDRKISPNIRGPVVRQKPSITNEPLQFFSLTFSAARFLVTWPSSQTQSTTGTTTSRTSTMACSCSSGECRPQARLEMPTSRSFSSPFFIGNKNHRTLLLVSLSLMLYTSPYPRSHN